MNLITSLLLLLICSRLFGRLFKLLGFQEIIGEILGGLLIGLTQFVSPSQELSGIVELSIFLLIFSAGLEMSLKDIFSAIRKKALICTFVSFSISFSTGAVLAYLIGLKLISILVVSLCFSITALPIVVSLIQNFKITDSRVGHLIVASAVLTDIIALLFLGIAFDMGKTNTTLEFLQTFAIKGFKMAVFFITVMIVNKFLKFEFSHVHKTEKLFGRMIDYLGSEAVFGVGVVFVLCFSTLSESLGFHFIIGAFFGGLLLNKDIIGTNAFRSMSNTLDAVTKHFLTPIFFAYIGLHFSIEAFEVWQTLLLVVVGAFISKIFGCWLGGRLAGISNRESLQMGIVLNSRGVLDLIVANLAFSKGYIQSDIFSILIFLGVSSVILNPILYRRMIAPAQTK